jgi:hypothetical protein
VALADVTIHPTSALPLTLSACTDFEEGHPAAVTVFSARRFQSVNNLERTNSNAILRLIVNIKGSWDTTPARQQGNVDITISIIVLSVPPLRNVGQDRLRNASQSCIWTGSEQGREAAIDREPGTRR